MNLPGKKQETNNTSNPCLDMFFFFEAISFWFPFLFTVNKYYHTHSKCLRIKFQDCVKLSGCCCKSRVYVHHDYSVVIRGAGPGANTREISDRLMVLKSEIEELDRRERELDQHKMRVQQSIKNVTDDTSNIQYPFKSKSDPYALETAWASVSGVNTRRRSGGGGGGVNK